jgi:hypothetical protein
MKIDYIKEKKEFISVALSGISILFAVLICMKIAYYFGLSAEAQGIVRTIKAGANSKRDDPNKYFNPAREMANSLKKSNLFTPPPEKKNPITEVSCILGNEAFISGKWCKEGEMVQDAKIASIEPKQVTIEWDGKTIVLKPLDVATASPGSGMPPGAGNAPTVGSTVVTSSPSSQEQVPPGRSTPSPSTAAVAPPSQQQIPLGTESVSPAGKSGTIPNMPSIQGQSPEQIEKQLRDAIQKMNTSKTDR